MTLSESLITYFLVPILREEAIETKRDLRFIHNPQKVELLDRIHVGSEPISFSDYENYYLHYQNDYVSIYDRELNQPYKIFAEVEVSGNALQNYKHHEKRMDSRSKVWNDFETPFFHPSLASRSIHNFHATVIHKNYSANRNLYFKINDIKIWISKAQIMQLIVGSRQICLTLASRLGIFSIKDASFQF